MQYYRNFELAKLYHVSQTAVGKWVEAARKGNLELVLIEKENKSYIANTAKNHATIKVMVQERKKYFNSRSLKTVMPKPEFYTLYSPEQVTDIISNIQVHREIPLQYNYFDTGAVYLDKYLQKRYRDSEPGLTLIEMNQDYLDSILTKYKRVNVIDIGPGNALPVRGLLEHLIKQNLLGRYLAIDISPEMLEITKCNIQEWFGDKVPFEAELRDITYERFTDLLTGTSLTGGYDDESINLILFLGGTLYNFRSPDEVLRNIHNSLAPPDLLVCTQKLDNEAARRYFEFNLQPKASTLSPLQGLIFDLLNIDDSLYTIEMGFDEQQRQRYIRVRFNIALSIEFQVGTSTRRVDINKDDAILLWRFWHQDSLRVISQFERNGFGVLQASQTEGHEYSLVVCDIKTER